MIIKTRAPLHGATNHLAFDSSSLNSLSLCFSLFLACSNPFVYHRHLFHTTTLNLFISFIQFLHHFFSPFNKQTVWKERKNRAVLIFVNIISKEKQRISKMETKLALTESSLVCNGSQVIFYILNYFSLFKVWFRNFIHRILIYSIILCTFFFLYFLWCAILFVLNIRKLQRLSTFYHFMVTIEKKLSYINVIRFFFKI